MVDGVLILNALSFVIASFHTIEWIVVACNTSICLSFNTIELINVDFDLTFLC
jgi:glutamate racemase